MAPSQPCPVPFGRSISAFRTEADALHTILSSLTGGWAARTTRLPAWDLHQLVAHAMRAATRVTAYLGRPAPDRAEIDWLDYWRRADDTDPDGVAQRAIEDASSLDTAGAAEAFGQAWVDALAAARDAGAAHLLTGPFGGMRLDHYLPTRVVELTVHGLDIRAALDLAETPTDEGAEVTTAVLEGLYGGRPPELVGDDVGFILAGTGRREHPDPDLPVLS